MKLYALQVAVYAILSSATAQAETGIVLDQKPSILKANSHSTMKADIARALSKRSGRRNRELGSTHDFQCDFVDGYRQRFSGYGHKEGGKITSSVTKCMYFQN